MICVSVGERDYREAAAVASLYSFAEIRLDLLETVDIGITAKIFSSHRNLIATYRKNSRSDSHRLSVLKAAVDNKAAFIDADINEPPAFLSAVKSLCTDTDSGLIISYHDYNGTPGFEVLDAVIAQALEIGADAVKIACTASFPEHVERLLSLPDYYSRHKIIIAGMGDSGSRVRILSRTAGSFFTYASHNSGKATASGQLDYKTLLREQKRLDNVRS
jgi:3-dehydroquinate dehydratase I